MLTVCHAMHNRYEYKNMIYVVIDLCENGDLYVLDPYSEGEAKTIMSQLLQAISYMHHRGIVHRDLKVRAYVSLSELVVLVHGIHKEAQRYIPHYSFYNRNLSTV